MFQRPSRLVPVILSLVLAVPAAAQVSVTGDGDVSLPGLSVTGDGDVEIGEITADGDGDVTIGGSLNAGAGGASIGGLVAGADGNVALGDISVGADGAVIMPGMRVEADGSVSMGSEINVAAMTEAMETPGASVNVSILFDSGSAALTADGKAQVAQVAEAFFIFDEEVKVLVEGHTDSVGSDADNFALSNARSQTVVNELKLVHDVDVTLLIGGKGESSPVASNDSAEGRALNRRVTFIRN
ncbi:OmpA family protein [Yoonia sp. 2307UL14-13]|uniref:OmpA family protein n=1 Tax=Yoonia sp. 2307UL14-13 TaxID=3126506 RepID=UPI0030A6A6EA